MAYLASRYISMKLDIDCFVGEEFLRRRGIEVVNMESNERQVLMELFVKEKPEVW